MQECFVIFAANLIRWASHWLANQAQPVENALNVRKRGVKRQIQVATPVSAQVIRDSEGKLLKLSEHSAFAGKVLRLPGGAYPPHDRPNLKFDAVFHRIASDCTTVTIALAFHLASVPVLGERLTCPSHEASARGLAMNVYDQAVMTDELVECTCQMAALPGVQQVLLKTS